jgi:hypothetical protein
LDSLTTDQTANDRRKSRKHESGEVARISNEESIADAWSASFDEKLQSQFSRLANPEIEMQEELRPIASLISKSEKAQQKLSPGSWQHAMLQRNLQALRLAFALMTGETDKANRFSVDDLQEALDAFAAMISKSEQGQAKFAVGTSHYSLQQNRIAALRKAEALIRVKLTAK